MKRLLAACGLAACNGTVGTLSVSLATAPGSHLLDAAQTLRLTLTGPNEVTTATRGANGFDIVIDVPANDAASAIIVEALDASGTRIAAGESPVFPLGAIDATIVVYMALPNTVGVAPATLTPARSDLAAGALTYGAVLAGGRDATGAPTDAIAIYNAYDHSLVGGMALPAPRAGMALGVGASNIVYLFGGTDANNNPTGSLWRFDTNASPNGSYADFGDKAGFARADQSLVALGQDQFLVTGMPAAQLAGLAGTVTAATGIASLPATGASAIGSDGVPAAIFSGDTGILRFRDGKFDTLDPNPRTGQAAVALPGGKVLLACGPTTADLVDVATGAITGLANWLQPNRSDGCAVAATARHIVIAGGTGAPDAVDVYDATTLMFVAASTLTVPRTNATATALPNGQVLIAGGSDGSGAPTSTLELFTPEPD